MDIIIVGCGKVGFTLVEQLSNEDHNIVVIDEKPEKVQYITDRLDVMGIVGNGINHKTLLEAGIATADLLIAVTGDDEKNLLCCVIAKKTGHCQTIARVRNPIYNGEIAFLKKEFGLAMIINPELTAANEISRVFQFPSAIRVDSFAKGHVELLHFKVSENSPLIHLKLFNLHQTLHSNVLVCTVIRGSEVIIRTVILNSAPEIPSQSLPSAATPLTFSVRSASSRTASAMPFSLAAVRFPFTSQRFSSSRASV